MKVSFVISSIGRKDDLQACISSIETAYEYTKAEIGVEIICVIESVDKIQLQMKFLDLSKFYYFDKINLSAARNYGIWQSRGDYLAFIDDDAAVKEDFLAVLLKNAVEGDAQAFCGRILSPKDDLPFSGCYQNETVKTLNWPDFNYFKGSDIIINKTLIDKVGGFDELFGSGSRYYGAEDSDLFFRLMRNNMKVKYLPELVIYHPVALSVLAARIFNYSYAVGAMLMKQLASDWKHSLFYLSLMALILFKSLVRTAQNIVFPKIMEGRNSRYRYADVFKGTACGIMDYLKNEIIRQNSNAI